MYNRYNFCTKTPIQQLIIKKAFYEKMLKSPKPPFPITEDKIFIAAVIPFITVPG